MGAEGGVGGRDEEVEMEFLNRTGGTVLGLVPVYLNFLCRGFGLLKWGLCNMPSFISTCKIYHLKHLIKFDFINSNHVFFLI